MNVTIEGEKSRRSIVNAQIITLMTDKEGKHLIYFVTEKGKHIEILQLTDDCSIYVKADIIPKTL